MILEDTTNIIKIALEIDDMWDKAALYSQSSYCSYIAGCISPFQVMLQMNKKVCLMAILDL